jgi:hypothetical protein
MKAYNGSFLKQCYAGPREAQNRVSGTGKKEGFVSHRILNPVRVHNPLKRILKIVPSNLILTVVKRLPGEGTSEE